MRLKVIFGHPKIEPNKNGSQMVRNLIQPDDWTSNIRV